MSNVDIQGKDCTRQRKQELKCNVFGLFKSKQGNQLKDSEINIEYW